MGRQLQKICKDRTTCSWNRHPAVANTNTYYGSYKRKQGPSEEVDLTLQLTKSLPESIAWLTTVVVYSLLRARSTKLNPGLFVEFNCMAFIKPYSERA